MDVIIRKGGTKCFWPKQDADKIEAFRQIVADKQYAMIEGITVDSFTASAVVKVYENINEANQVKLAAMPVPRIARVCMNLIGRV